MNEFYIHFILFSLAVGYCCVSMQKVISGCVKSKWLIAIINNTMQNIPKCVFLQWRHNMWCRCFSTQCTIIQATSHPQRTRQSYIYSYKANASIKCCESRISLTETSMMRLQVNRHPEIQWKYLNQRANESEIVIEVGKKTRKQEKSQIHRWQRINFLRWVCTVISTQNEWFVSS